MKVHVWLTLALLVPSGLTTAQQKPGESFRDCPDCPEMVVIPAGTYTLGSPDDEPGRLPIEGPTKRVSVAQFAAGKFPVTRGQWSAFVAATKRETKTGCAWTGRSRATPDPAGSWSDLGFPQDDNHPVVCVSWPDAQDYVQWLSRRTGQKYRLLTESEWEYAARAGTTTAYPWGSTASHEHANYGAEKCCSPAVAGRDTWEGTAPVDGFPPNAFGVHMHGNVLQWVQDCFAASYADLPTDGSAYETDITLNLSGGPAPLARLTGTQSCSKRMTRGSNWNDPPTMVRSAFRNFGPPFGATLQDYRSGGIGFRVARTAP
jgi:formylglycine-generating enzyme required for sulfatase activity